MSLLRGTAKEALQGFDPKTGNPNDGGFDNIPAGEYDALLVDAKHKVFQSGWEAFAIEIDVVGGEYDGRKEFINIGFRGDNIPEFVFNKNIKLVAQLAFVCNLALTDADWEDELSLQWAFKEAIGQQFVMAIEETKNKKDPNKPYRNFAFAAYQQNSIDPFAGQSINIQDEDSPF